ncbi:cytochrome P450 [Apiospora hydei]|uniref:Cytochrome P450 n=1 Tax=Apiospora hydei TaxID=1337664 RepID=A0ABR1UUE3_9PEZI
MSAITEQLGPVLNQESLFCLGGALSGVSLHHGVFIRGEWHNQAPIIFRIYAAIFGFVATTRIFYRTADPADRQASCLVLASFFHVLGMFASILIYRRFFHRLNKANFPGPRWASNRILYPKHFTDKQRPGPSEVTVFLPEAHEVLGGRQSECIKSEFYDLLWPERALFAARDKAVHAKRRKDWQYGFSPGAMEHHERKVLQWVDELDRQLATKAKDRSTVNATDYFLWFTFDIMGSFTFSKSFNMLERQRWHHIVLKTQNARSLLGPLTGTPWLLHIGVKIMPRILWVRDWYESVEWCQAQMLERLETGSLPGVPDLTSFFMRNKNGKSDPWLAGDSLLAILAGSCHSRGDASSSKPFDGGSRKTMDNGVNIGDYYIPPHTTVITPHYTIARREDCFVEGTKFIPERWTTRPQMVLNPAAHIPFSIGKIILIVHV